jgi:catechol 2,3-dioxygenase-like lactoylglutathione lyase family enzyme
MEQTPHAGDPTPVTRPGTVAVRAFDHVGMSVPDLDTAVDFFVRGFGARPQFRMDRPTDDAVMGAERLGLASHVQFALAMLELGGSRIELLQWWPARGSSTPPDADLAGGSHVALDVADVAAALKVLRSFEGVEVVGEPVTFAPGATPGLTNAFVRTPWGALIELVTWQGAGH